MSERTHCVVVNAHQPIRWPVSSGVSLGLVLGPILFLIYVNKIDSVVESFILKFADDTGH